MNKKLLVINAVGLTKSLINNYGGFTKQFLDKHNCADLTAPYPAVTCTSQANILTGKTPSEHGIVANGWLFRDLSQILLWRQSNHLVNGEKIWDVIRKSHPNFTVAKMFWWYNMYSTANWSMTPRPIYRSDGLKLPHTYGFPAQLNESLKEQLGPFPLFKFWGPMTSIDSTAWIANATIETMRKHQPNLCLTYLPHLDYNLQRLGHSNEMIKKDVEELDQVIASLVHTAEEYSYDVVILSEYGIQDVNYPIHINRILRQNNYITPTVELFEEHPDPGASRAFALADHQIAHIYIKNANDIPNIKKLLEKEKGIARVLDKGEQEEIHLNHARSGELVALAEPNAWFTYYYWLDDSRAPDFARTVDIHKKPGYDPVELFVNPGSKGKIIWTLLKKKLGFRYLLDVIPLDASLVKGSHGVPTLHVDDGPLLISSKEFNSESTLLMEDVFLRLREFFKA